jgi:bifunctional non-homologous end joining protein LigD
MPTHPPDIEPIILLPWATAFDGPDWIFEPKYDGFRGVLYSSPSGCEIRTPRTHRPERFADLCPRLSEVLRGRDAVLDGEIVALDPKGKPVMRDLLKGRGYLAFAASDLLWLDGLDLRSLPLAERKRRLGDLLPSDTGPLYKTFTLNEHGRALFQVSRKLELEGIVAKRIADPYSGDTIWYVIRNPGYRATAAAPRERRRRRGRLSSGSPRSDGLPT